MQSNPQKIYAMLTDSAGSWILIDDICERFRLTRRIVGNNIRLMATEQAHLYPGIRKSSKRVTVNDQFGRAQAKFNIKFKVEV